MSKAVKLILAGVVMGVIITIAGACLAGILTEGDAASDTRSAVVIAKGTTEEMLTYAKENKLAPLYVQSGYYETSLVTAVEDDEGVIGYAIPAVVEDYFNELKLGEVITVKFEDLE